MKSGFKTGLKKKSGLATISSMNKAIKITQFCPFSYRCLAIMVSLNCDDNALMDVANTR